MSSKSTIACGEGFHFYTEMFDEENVYLHLTPADFEATSDSLTVAIPLAILETIRRTEPMSFELVQLSDDGLLERATVEADRQHQEHEEYCKQNPDWQSHPMSKFLTPSPRRELIDNLLSGYKTERGRQQAILAKMQTYEITNGAIFGFDFRDGTNEVLVGTVTDGVGQSLK